VCGENIVRTVHAVIERLRAEFVEMPGLRLTREQVQRLCGIEKTMCQVVLESLVDARFLCVHADGTYARLTDGDVTRFRVAKAEIRTQSQTHKAS